MEAHVILTVLFCSLVGFETWEMAFSCVNFCLHKVADDAAAEVVYKRVDCFRDKNAKTCINQRK